MVTEEKKQVVEELTEKFNESKTAILTSFRGLDVESMNELRDRLREEDVEYKVAKNTLTGIAAEKAGFEELTGLLAGPTGIAFGYKDAVSAARVLGEFMEDNDLLEIKGGMAEGRIVDKNQIDSLAKIASRDVLLGQVARGMQAPLAGLVNSLQGVIRSFVFTLDAIREQKGEA